MSDKPEVKQEVWAWLKAERQWKDKVEQWLKAEGVPEHYLALRRMGIATGNPPPMNRAFRRRMGMKKIGRWPSVGVPREGSR